MTTADNKIIFDALMSQEATPRQRFDGVCALERILKLSADEIITRWMLENNLATGHGDTPQDMLDEAYAQIYERGVKASKCSVQASSIEDAVLRDLSVTER